jgi:hypothetical protein
MQVESELHHLPYICCCRQVVLHNSSFISSVFDTTGNSCYRMPSVRSSSCVAAAQQSEHIALPVRCIVVYIHGSCGRL